MNSKQFFHELDAAIAKYDLLCHPFYKAWAAGELTRDDLREYAQDYYHHVEAFPTYLEELALRLEEGGLRKAILANMADEKGITREGRGKPRAHSELWLDFVEGMGGDRVVRNPGVPALDKGMDQLVQFFHMIATEGSPGEALAAFYAYESQVPRVAAEKARGLEQMYGADEKTRGYFTLHATADIYHSQVWRNQLRKRIEANPIEAERALLAAQEAAKALWRALDGIEERRTCQAAA